MIKPRKKRSNKKRRIFFLIILLFLVLVYIFLFSPLFRIQAIEVSGNREVEVGEIENKFNYQNIFLITDNEIKDNLFKKIPKIADLEISKNLIKRTVKLIIKEREKLGIVCQLEIGEDPESSDGAGEEQVKACFYIDKTGVIFEEAPQTSGSLILLIKDYSQRDFYLGKQVFKERIVNFISQAKEGLFSETSIRSLDFNILSFPVKELKVMTSEGWYILFDLEREAENQILALKVALEEKIENRESLEYVDLRIENRIYYK